MTIFNDRLAEAIKLQNSHVCVGLDPDIEKVSETIWPEVLEELEEFREANSAIANTLESLREEDDHCGCGSCAGGDGESDTEECEECEFDVTPGMVAEAASRLYIDVCAEYAAAFKLNAAFFEPELTSAEVVAECLEELGSPALTIFDGKRGDIGNSSDHYASAVFDLLGFDSITVNPLMGYDAVAPFIADPERGCFLLCLTSNRGAEDFLLKNDLYLRIAERAVEWNREGNVGLVVGATRPEYAARVREVAPDLPMLVPGVGAQGGALAETLDAIRAKQNRRFLVNASRSIMFAERKSDAEHQLEACARATRELRDSINALLK